MTKEWKRKQVVGLSQIRRLKLEINSKTCPAFASLQNVLWGLSIEAPISSDLAPQSLDVMQALS